MSHLSQEHVQHLYDTFGELNVLDDVIRHRAADEPPVPILGYPRSEYSVNDYELFTGKQLDRFIDTAVKHFILLGFRLVRGHHHFHSPDPVLPKTYRLMHGYRICGRQWPFWLLPTWTLLFHFLPLADLDTRSFASPFESHQRQ